ncbi:MAG: Fe-Mn family superoxide dismutase [Myxococcota bacterium]
MVLDHDLRTQDLRLYWAGGHTQTVALGLPVLVCDLHEHSYAIDYGARAAEYVDAFWANIEWAEVDRRLAKAEVVHL